MDIPDYTNFCKLKNMRHKTKNKTNQGKVSDRQSNVIINDIRAFKNQQKVNIPKKKWVKDRTRKMTKEEILRVINKKFNFISTQKSSKREKGFPDYLEDKQAANNSVPST